MRRGSRRRPAGRVTDALRGQLQADLGPGFVIERELGGGGMSRVFLAQDLALERQVVVKVLAPELAAGVSVERFRREILVVAALQHPNIVPVLSAGEVAVAGDGAVNVLPFFTMPYVKGASLRERIGEGPCSVGETVAILRDVARGLAHAHAHGIVHRDIKPENILLSGTAAAVTDFGVAKALSSARKATPGGAITVVGISLGTPAYMAPEQAAGDPDTDHRADLYALGIVGYELLTGSAPFTGRSTQAVIAAQLAQRPAPIEQQRRDLPPALAGLIMRCLAKDPADRPQSADAFLAELDAAPGPAAARRNRAAIAALVLVAAVLAGWLVFRTAGAPASADLSAIAVLPFVNTGGDPRDEYFSDGMTDELASALARVQGLRVASRTSAFAFKGRRELDVREIGRRLGVGAVLEGTVRRDGRRLRLGAQLTNTTDGLSIWSQSYEREVSDIFAMQDELARAIVAALAPSLSAGEGASRDDVVVQPGRRSRDLAAYDLYLKGRYFWHQRGDASLRTAATHFEEAIARDPGFAAAHAGLADVLALLPVYGTTPADSVLPLAREHAERAIALDSTLAEAHTTLGLVHRTMGEWARSEQALRRALALDPTSAAAHQWQGEVFVITGRLAEAAAALRRAHQLDPMSPIIAAELGYMLTLAGEAQAGVAMGERAVTLAPGLWTGHAFLGSSHLFAGNPAAAVPRLERAVALAPEVALFRGVLSLAYAKVGRQGDARRLLAELEREAGEGGAASPVSVAYVGLGDLPRALDWLERAAAARDPYLLQMSLTATWFDPLRGDPRFAGVARALGLDPVAMARRTGR